MKKIIKEYKKEGYVQVTTTDERFYIKPDNKGNNIYYPSVTWICEFYPKGIAFYKWLAQHSWDETQAIKNAAGDKGSKVHQAIVDLIDGKEVSIEAKYYNDTKGEDEELTPQEYECLMSFYDWWKLINPVVVAREVVVFNEEYKYAGTIDLICKLNNALWVIDFKTGQNIWPSWELQLSAYRHAIHYKEVSLAVLQLGYRHNKRKHKFTPIEDKFDLFLSAYKIWQEEGSKIQPKQVDYPLSLKLEVRNEG